MLEWSPITDIYPKIKYRIMRLLVNTGREQPLRTKLKTGQWENQMEPGTGSFVTKLKIH